MLVGLFFLHFLRPEFHTTRKFIKLKGPVNFFAEISEDSLMQFDNQLATLDYIFPFFVFCYGIVMIFVLENKTLDKLARERFPDGGATLRSHKGIAYISLFVGGLWSLQNLLFS